VRELRRRFGDALFHERPVKADHLRGSIHIRTGRLEDIQRFGKQKRNSDIFEDGQRSLVDLLQFVRPQHLEGSVGILKQRPRPLRNTAAV
jgi:hypothetical protein